MNRPSMLDRQSDFRNEPVTNPYPLTAAESAGTAAMGVASEHSAELSKEAELKKLLAATENEMHAAKLRADEAMTKFEPLQAEVTTLRDQLNRLEVAKTEAEARATKAEASLEGAEKDAADYKDAAETAKYDLQKRTALLAEAEKQIDELTKPKEPVDEPSPKQGEEDE